MYVWKPIFHRCLWILVSILAPVWHPGRVLLTILFFEAFFYSNLGGSGDQKSHKVQGPAAGAEACGNQFLADFWQIISHAWRPAKGRGGGSKGLRPLPPAPPALLRDGWLVAGWLLTGLAGLAGLAGGAPWPGWLAGLAGRAE